MGKVKSFREHRHEMKMKEQRTYTDEDVRELIRNYNQNQTIEDRVSVIFELLLSLISKSYSKSIHETKITTRQMSISSMAMFIRKLSQQVKKEDDVSKKLNLLADLVIYSVQLLDMENTGIYKKCEGGSND